VGLDLSANGLMTKAAVTALREAASPEQDDYPIRMDGNTLKWRYKLRNIGHFRTNTTLQVLNLPCGFE
jgi:hypothetical protein